ncbi:MAG TPA: type II toxin-antitoxin system prevent-host-death family antitoxin [Terrimesophilobacter sp.]|nr:type II toxin-antitoxin system prevent-host-death family antitoxin [Terrimesophilobacter sp.]
MKPVTHREMRNQSAEILRRVEAGESFIVTNNGRAAAVIGPTQGRTVDELIEQGQGRGALRDILSLRDIVRLPSKRSSSELLDDSRGSW